MRACPVEYLRHLRPVAHLLVGQMLHRSAGDNHAVETLVAHQLEILVERPHVFDGRILGRVAAEFHEREFDLQRCVRQQAHHVGLRRYLQRHEVEDDDAQRADVLPSGARMVDDEYVFLLQ